MIIADSFVEAADLPDVPEPTADDVAVWRERLSAAATTIVAAGTEQDDGREWGSLPLTAATVSVAPSAVYHPDWWRSGYQRYVAGPMRRAYQSSTVDVLDGLGVDVDADDPTLDDAWAELDDQVSGEWGAGLGDWVAGQVRQAATDGSSVDEVTASMRGSEDGWFSAGRAVLLAANAAAAAWNRATVASTTAARAQGTSSTKTWVTVGDDKVRDSHVDMDGVSVDAGSDFLVSGAYEAAGPHDARLPVEEVVNCRCSLMVSADGGDGVDDETTSVGDDGVQLDYETDDGEEPLVASVLGLGPFAAEFHTHGRCLGCGGWLEGRKYCHKCGDGYAGPLLDAGSERPTGVDDDARSDNPALSAATIEDARDAGQVAAGGVDQEDDPAMTTTAPGAGITVTSGVSTFATTTNGDPAQFASSTSLRLPAHGYSNGSGLGLVPWRGVIAVEGKPTGDGRMFRAASGDQRGLWWDEQYLPADVFAMLQDPDGGSGHDGSAIAGRIDRMWKQAADGYVEVWAEGVYDTSTPTGAEVFRLQQLDMLTGVSVDVDSVKVVMPEALSPDDMLMEMLFGSGVEEYSEGRIRRVTVCSIPAFIEARIYPVSDGGTLVASAAAEGFAGLRAWLPLEGNGQPGTLVASAAAFTTAAPRPVDVFHSALTDRDPPADVFARRKYDSYTLFTVDADGRVGGHASPWGECHIGITNECVTAPRSTCGYAHARNGHVLTDDGQLIATARVFAQFAPGRHGHAPEELLPASAKEWYENQCCVVADVAVYEDDFGIQIQGRVRPGITRNQLVAFRASRISPDWRKISGRFEAVAFAVVNVSGFTTSANAAALLASAVEAGIEVPVDGELRGSAYIVDGADGSREVLTLIASGGPSRDPESPLVGLVQSLAARVDELEQAELARVAAAAMAGLPSVEEENARYAAQVAALLEGVELGADPEPFAVTEGETAAVVSITEEELATLRAAAVIAERLSQRPVEAADDGQTQTCGACGATGLPMDAAVCPECGAPLDGQGGDMASETVEVFADGMVKCPECGWMVKADAESCPHCGAELAAEPVVASAGCGCGSPSACTCESAH